MTSTEIELPAGFEHAPRLLAMGAELKSSLCVLEKGMARLLFVSGNLEQEKVLRDYCALLDTMDGLDSIALDMHPDYVSTQQGWRLAERWQLPVTRVQHHHAHIAACMAEHGLPLSTFPVLGVAMDGLGMGEDGTFWGAEFLLADYAGFKRLASFEPMPMLGGAKAVREPWRSTLAYLLALGWPGVAAEFAQTEIVDFLQQQPLALLQEVQRRGINSPMASSCGRLFDAVAATLGLHREQIEFEAQAAIALQAQAMVGGHTDKVYPYLVTGHDHDLLSISWLPMWSELLADVQAGISPSLLAAAFHQTLAQAMAEMIVRLCHQQATELVVLSGGVFQNSLLLEALVSILRAHGQRVLAPQRLPAHDGGVAVGQALVAAARWTRERGCCHD